MKRSSDRLVPLGIAALVWLSGALTAHSVYEPSVSPPEVPSHDPATPADVPRAAPSAARTAAYAKGQLIVKYRDTVEECVHCLMASHRALQAVTTDHNPSLDQLHAKYGVTRATPLFRTAADEAALHGPATVAALRQQQVACQGAQAQHLPRRAQRAPADVTPPTLHHVYLLELKPDVNIQQAVADFARDPHVEYAQPNYQMQAYFTPNDPYFTSAGSWGQPYDDLWGLKKIQAASAWDTTQGAGTVVAVVDTGVDYTHPDLAANIWTNPDEIPNNGVDDDGNGFIDDVRGWDFATNTNDPMDRFGHGTHVAGTIAAVGNNGLGIIGVAPQAKIMPVKGLDNNGGGTTESLAQALVYAATNGADVINNSWGCAGGCAANPAAEEAVRTAMGLGAVVVFAAGNDGWDVINYSPQNMTDPKPIVVAASTQEDTPTFFTNVGMLLDVTAPGGGTTTPPPSFGPFRNILSLKSSVCNPGMCDPNLLVGGSYVRQAGTSMAAPHAAGVAALVLANRPTFTPEEVRQVLRASADDLNAPGFDITTGAGRLNAGTALTMESVLHVVIARPANGERLGPEASSLVVTGTAAGPQFQRYELFYGAGINPTTWLPIGTAVTAPVENGALGTWDISSLVDNAYTLRLVATDARQLQFQAIAVVAVERHPPQRITLDPSMQQNAKISGHRIVWEDYRNGVADIYLYDLATRAERAITTHSAQQLHPAISGDRIVWMDNRNGNSDNYNWDIYLYDLSTNTERRITTNPSHQIMPSISGDRIVWMDSRNGAWDIYLYDLATNTERQITTNPEAQGNPAISGNKIVWEDWRNHTVDIYLYDLATNTERQITTEPAGWQIVPAIDGDRIVWADSRNGYYDIYLYDLMTNTERRLTTDANHQWGPAISGDRIVWMDLRNGTWDIYLYDLATNAEQSIATGPSRQWFPAISGDRVVWEDSRNGNGDIYMVDLHPDPPMIAPIGNKTVAEGQTLTVTLAASDPDGDPLTYAMPYLPAGATFGRSGSSGYAFKWTPTYTQTGSYLLTATVTDPSGLSDTAAFSITVTNTNRPPMLTPIGNKTAKKGQRLTFTVSATDPDGDKLSYGTGTLPPWATFDAKTRTFSWIPGPNALSSYQVKFKVADPGGLQDSETITISVSK